MQVVQNSIMKRLFTKRTKILLWLVLLVAIVKFLLDDDNQTISSGTPTSRSSLLSRVSVNTKEKEVDVTQLLKNGSMCGKWKDNCGEVCRNEEGYTSRIVHFTKLDSNFTFLNWVSVLSVYKFIRPDIIYMYSLTELDGCWWQQIAPLVRHIVVSKEFWTETLNGEHVTQLAHLSDFIRPFLLYYIGGIYLDLDIIVVKSFENLFDRHQVVLTRRDNGMVFSGGRISPRYSCFECFFALTQCRNFDGSWHKHSSTTLKKIVEEESSLFEGLKVLDHANSFCPFNGTSVGLKVLFSKDIKSISGFKLSDVYGIHLFNSVSSKRNYLKLLDNYEWISKSESIVANAVRLSLPSTFNEEQFNGKYCYSDFSVK